MSRAEQYAWVTKPPARPAVRPRRSNPGRRSGRTFHHGPCTTCGWAPLAWRKTCPACLTLVPR